MRVRQLAGFPIFLLVVGALGASTGCGGDSGSAAAPGGGAEAASSVDPRAAAEAEKSALAAYAGYLAASRKAELAADPHDPGLRKYLGDPLLTRVRIAIRDAKEHGAMRTGNIVSDPVVTEVSLDAVPATVSIQDCIDTTGYKLIYQRDRSVVPGSVGGRYVATATASRYPDGRWLVNESGVHKDQPC
ncbi:hypothetical protein [Plantactinospora sp. CA-290183]|uniref:hypothetical protein n=1 Tax=Plantactinospora sp. CA-290183 TaxID=3240006 RepID=UPI003D8B85CF